MSADLRPNFIERLFLLLDQIGAGSILSFGVSVDGDWDEARLVEAVARLLADAPRLATVVRTGPVGFSRRARPTAASELVARPTDLDAWRSAPFDLAAQPPVRFAIGPDATLWAALHHSVTDARGGWLALAHLGAWYAALDGGPAPAPLPRVATAFTRGYFAPLPREAKVALLRSASRAATPLAHALGRTHAPPFATFTDAPLPTSGRRAQASLLQDMGRVSNLLRAAARRRASLTDLTLAASIRAALDVWPAERGRPVQVSLPVDLRHVGERDVANRAGIHDFSIRGLGPAEKLLTEIRPETARARDRAFATSALGHRAVLSRLPPAAFRALAQGYFTQPVNHRESLGFAAFGALEPPLRTFGRLAVRDLFMTGDLLAPPGLRVGTLPTPRGLRVSIEYLDPATRPATAQRLAHEIDRQLEAFAAEAAPRRRRARVTEAGG